ncbi:hypothetical protein Hdeb2414_s0023g00642801 [Helianthus debilis subsp. tardiflorus]
MANLLRCRRIGCTATFTEDDNPDDSYTYHESLFVLCVWALSTNRTSLIHSSGILFSRWYERVELLREKE